MRILMVAPEVSPFSKEGGLADVLGSLPTALADLGEEVCVLSPLYRRVRRTAEELGVPLERVPEGDVRVPIGDARVAGVTWRTVLPGTAVHAYFLENERYYDRAGYYTKPEDNSDYQDNSERFIFLSRGALEVSLALGLAPDVIHAHDWPTGLVPIYVRHVYGEQFARAATVFTIHNIAYQGIFWHWDMNLAGLPWNLFNWKMLEYYGNLSFLKAGLVGADVLTTVSKKYSEEIRTEEHGCGMEGVLQERADDLYGIVNGIEMREWDPATDELIPAHYSADDLSGKVECKRALQERFGLHAEPDALLLGMVCRLVDQKGLDLLEAALPLLIEVGVQVVVLGRGEPRYHTFLSETQAQHARSVGVLLDYDNEAAHLIQAGADAILMPSRFEPCGLNQLYGLRYGTVPIVRATGGLADTVCDYSEGGLQEGRATGFVFEDYGAADLVEAVQRALAVYRDGDAWRRVMLNGMRQDWSWRRSAAEYVEVYEKALQKLTQQVPI
jgi:starch synthase